jgi:GT2 family glycosyltransferase
MKKISLIIISYNSKNAIFKCLSKLIETGKYPVIIVDNASTDNSSKILKERFPTAEVIALEQNIGYGRATNIGLRKANTPYAMLLNPDLYATPENIEQILHHAELADKKTAILAPAVKKKDFTGDAPESVKWISGSAILFDMEKLKTIGFFDENIFLFSEETDLCKRTLDAGYKIILCHDIYMKHLKGQSSAPNQKIEYMKNWHFGWSRAYYFTKHNLASGKKNIRRMFWIYLFKSLISTDKEKQQKYKARAIGVKAFIKGEKAFYGDGHPKASPAHQTQLNP